jgi:hypothetical protein
MTKCYPLFWNGRLANAKTIRISTIFFWEHFSSDEGMKTSETYKEFTWILGGTAIFKMAMIKHKVRPVVTGYDLWIGGH